MHGWYVTVSTAAITDNIISNITSLASAQPPPSCHMINTQTYDHKIARYKCICLHTAKAENQMSILQIIRIPKNETPHEAAAADSDAQLSNKRKNRHSIRLHYELFKSVPLVFVKLEPSPPPLVLLLFSDRYRRLR